MGRVGSGAGVSGPGEVEEGEEGVALDEVETGEFE